MKKINDKQLYKVGIGVLAAIVVVLVFAVGSRIGGPKPQDDLLAQKDAENVSVEAIIQSTQANNVVVPEIKPSLQTSTENTKEEQVIIEAPMPKEPEKPELVAPESKPQTKDNMNDPDKVPTYNDKDVVKEGEVVTVTEEKKTNEPVTKQEDSKPTDSKLVPPSENPFANPANVGKPIEVTGEDFYEDGRKAGEGDKF